MKHLKYGPMLLLMLLLASKGFGQIYTKVEERRPASLLLKAGALGTAREGGELQDRFGGLLALEWALSKNMSLNAGLERPYSVSDHERRAFGEFRYYFESHIAKAHFSGTYLAPSFYFSGAKSESSPMDLNDFRSPTDPKAFQLNKGYGLRFGREVLGLIDFGLMAGVDNAIEKTRALATSQFEVKNTALPFLRSYFRFHLPFALDGKGAFSPILKSGERREKILKLGLDDLFDFSKRGIYFNPVIAYEQRVAKRTSVNLESQFNFSRFKAFDLLNDSALEFSEEKYLNQNLSFSAELQGRYYVVPFKSDKSGENLSLEGIYAGMLGRYYTHSNETFRQYWSFDKNNRLDLGINLGMQKSFARHYLVDVYVAYAANLYAANEGAKKGSLLGGIQFYWIPDLP
ncbi:hypothetical protein LAG90_16830 [Marinilongibacter aquaticus]|uniref:hypothetical protein n=1 Tax=Marinilongibacter aquaticus TaxID=2975157 RepID=UPI0021BD7D69|nr:hypothetical protein [Marinilongibacter aquaticus]UBM58470.1 hypothetical protein LAG90_16830 [Marinilongibacter aquaticus]